MLVCLFFANDPAHADDIYVATAYSNTIVKFDSNGNGSVFANSGLNQPRELAFDSSGNLYAANYGNSTIVKFDLRRSER